MIINVRLVETMGTLPKTIVISLPLLLDSNSKSIARQSAAETICAVADGNRFVAVTSLNGIPGSVLCDTS